MSSKKYGYVACYKGKFYVVASSNPFNTIHFDREGAPGPSLSVEHYTVDLG